MECIEKNFEKKTKGTLLDVGCGDSLFNFFLAESGFIVRGIDIEKGGIRLAEEKPTGVNGLMVA